MQCRLCPTTFTRYRYARVFAEERSPPPHGWRPTMATVPATTSSRKASAMLRRPSRAAPLLLLLLGCLALVSMVAAEAVVGGSNSRMLMQPEGTS